MVNRRGVEIEPSPLILDAPLSALEGRSPEEYAEALRTWAGDPVDLYPRLDKKEAKGGVVSFRLQESFERAVDRIVQLARERGLPWQSRTDFARDAVVWFTEVVARRLDVSDPLLSSLTHAQDIRDRLEMMSGARKRADDSVKSITSLLSNLILSGNKTAARRELSIFRQSVAAMTETYIRRQYEQAIEAGEQLKVLMVTLETE